MPEYTTKAAGPDKMSADDILRQMEEMRREIDGLSRELRAVKSDNENLKECIVRMAMKREGVCVDA